ncbi:MAG: endonuclease/exonuclease/phosphatase family protein [Bacteroidaceae bacterium]|nr:endonuclease/exonuclease/phosphatase family protein [Bacteroidaceae bacterium]
MKKTILLALALLIPFMVNSKSVNGRSGDCKLRWGTFNIRLQNGGDEKAGVGWSVRRDRVADYIKRNHIDVIGMQEVLHTQLEDLLQRLPEYDYVGVGRTDGATKGEYSPVFFLKERFEVLEKGNFWLSETPDVPGSVGWDAALERIASYAKLRDKATGKVFMAVNTHFDHVGVKARRESAKLIMRKIQEIVGMRPAVVTGDFNVTEDDEAYTTMLGGEMVNGQLMNCKFNDAYHMTPNHTGTCYTWHQFCQIPPLKCEKIDFIFITPTIRVNHSHIEVPNPAAMLSDHNPHWADLEF